MNWLRLGFLAAALPVLCLAAREPASRASYKDVVVERRGGTVEVRLPLTDVTGKVRVKALAAGRPGDPVAPARTALGSAHYLEWQIGYDTPDPAAPALAEGVRIQRKGRWKFGAELTRILQEARRAGILPAEDLRSLRAELPGLAARSLASTEQLTLAPADGPAPAGFERWLESAPLLRCSTPQGWVQLELRPRQRGIGLQPMLYVCLPFHTWREAGGNARASGPASPKETVRVHFATDTRPLLLAIVRGFGSASAQHAEDLGQILEALLSEP